MKRFLIIGAAAGILIIGMLCVGLFLGILVTPARAQIGQAIGQVLERVDPDRRATKNGKVQTPLAQVERKPEKGVLVMGLFAGSPADQAGIARGDIILRIDEQEVNTVRELREALSQRQAGDRVALLVQHGDQQKTVTVTLAAPVSAGSQAQGQEATPAPGAETPKRSNGSGLPFLGIVPSGANENPMGMGPGMIMPGERGDILPLLEGAPVVEVMAGSPAEKAGIQAGDVIVSVDGTPVDGQHSLPALIGSHQPGDEVNLEIQPAGASDANEKRTVTVTLGANPDSAGKAWLGVRIGGMGRFPMDGPMPRWNFPDPNNPPGQGPGRPSLPGPMHPGARIDEVVSGSPAESAGLKAGQLILAVDGKELAQPQDLATIIGGKKPGDTVTLTVAENGLSARGQEVRVTLGENPEKAGAAWLGVRYSGIIIQPGSEEPLPQG